MREESSRSEYPRIFHDAIVIALISSVGRDLPYYMYLCLEATKMHTESEVDVNQQISQGK